VSTVGDRTDRGLNELPAPVVVKRLLNGARNVRTTTAGADSAIELANDFVRERNVQTHGHSITH